MERNLSVMSFAGAGWGGEAYRVSGNNSYPTPSSASTTHAATIRIFSDEVTLFLATGGGAYTLYYVELLILLSCIFLAPTVSSGKVTFTRTSIFPSFQTAKYTLHSDN